MKNLIFFFVLTNMVVQNKSFAQDDATKDLFNMKCGICHTIGGGKLIGPDLANVRERYADDWLIPYIRSSQTMINNGDPDAIAIYEEYNKVIMPDPLIDDNQIRSILDYIMSNSAGGTGTAEFVSTITDATEEHLENGKNLFQGRKRLANGGPSCISCHNELSGVFFSENSYSIKDVTESFTTLGEAGVLAILSNPPFPVMAKAFEGHKLEENEIHDLLVFLQGASAYKASRPNMSSGYLLYGLMGAFGLIFILTQIWYYRRVKPVNHLVFNRQARSSN